MLDQIILNNFVSKLQVPTYDSAQKEEAAYDFEVICQKLIRAEICLAIIRDADYEKCRRVSPVGGRLPDNFGQGGESIEFAERSLGIKGTINFKKRSVYRYFIIGQFFDIISEICSATDVLGGLLHDCYSHKGADTRFSLPTGTRPYFPTVLNKIIRETTVTHLKTFLQTRQALLDHTHFLPTTPMNDIDLTNCAFSFDLIRKLRNVPSHSSYEKMIIFTDPPDDAVIKNKLGYYPLINHKADEVCEFNPGVTIWARLSDRKDGSRDLRVFSQWVLQQTIDSLNLIINTATNDL